MCLDETDGMRKLMVVVVDGVDQVRSPFLIVPTLQDIKVTIKWQGTLAPLSQGISSTQVVREES